MQEVVSQLRRISQDHSDRLSPATRARILATAAQASRTARLSSPFVLSGPKLLAAAAVITVLALPALQMRQTGSPVDRPVRDLEVSTQGGQVVLTWKDSDQPHRVVRATSREELARLSQLPSENVSGEKWVDASPGDAALVYYLVE